MVMSTQANRDSIDKADAHAQGIDGGLNLKTDASKLAPPATTRSDNGWYVSPGVVGQLPAFASTMQAATSHVYNIHARDLQQPSTTGDIMLHGEVRDAPDSATNLFTSPLWSDGNGATSNYQQPLPPWNARTRIMTGRLSVEGGGVTDRSNLMTARQEAGDPSSLKYAMGYYDGSTYVYVTFSLLDGQVELPYTLSYNLGAAQFVQMAGIQGTQHWVIVALNGQTLTSHRFDFAGNFISKYVITTSCQSVTATLGQISNTFEVVQHAGKTFAAYINQASTTRYEVNLCNLINNGNLTTGRVSATSTGRGFCVVSPYTHTPQTGTTYLGIVHDGSFVVMAQPPLGASAYQVGATLSLPVAANTGASSTQGTADFSTTAAACIFDDKGGTGATASLGFTVFQHYPEQLQFNSAAAQGWWQSLAVTTFSFQAQGGVTTLVASNYFRTPSGVALCSKAFSANPPEAQYAGASGAKNAYVLVRCGAFEPSISFDTSRAINPYISDSTYGQPTYFIIDHQARVVGRFFDSLAPLGDDRRLANNGSFLAVVTATAKLAYASPAYSLATPLFSTSNGDLSLCDITLPVWAQVNSIPRPVVTSYGVTYYRAMPAGIIQQPANITLSLSAQAASCPPVQAGPYTVLSGPMTCIHDGRGVVEANYHFQTHNPVVSVTTTTTGPGAGSSGTYYWRVVWEWYDSLGRIHRSTPSAQFPGVVGSGAFLKSANVYCPPPVTAKAAVGGVLYARLYRSELNATSGIYYLVSTTTVQGYSDSNRFSTLVDSGFMLDASVGTNLGVNALTQQPRLYTSFSNGVYAYASQPPLPFIWQCGAKGRAFGLTQTFGQQRLYYTSAASGQFPFEWNQLNYAPIPPDLGDVRSIEAIDDKIILFGTRHNGVMNGDGPGGATTDVLGTPIPNDGFSMIQPLPTPAGIVGTGAPARIPDGLVFQGISGIQLVGRDLTIQPIGAAVDPLTGRQVGNRGTVYGRALTIAALQSVVWCNPTGAPLVYNYLTQKWSTWPLLAGAVAMAQRLDGQVYAAIQPVSGAKFLGLATATTPGADYGVLGTGYAPIYRGLDTSGGLVLETPWILPGGTSGGEGQLWDCTITGSYMGPHQVQIEQAYNYASQYTSMQNFPVTAAPLFYQFRVRPRSASRVWAVRYRITLLPLTTLSSGYAMATLNDLVVNFGSKQGTTRLGAPFSG